MRAPRTLEDGCQRVPPPAPPSLSTLLSTPTLSAALCSAPLPKPLHTLQRTVVPLKCALNYTLQAARLLSSAGHGQMTTS